MLVGALGLFPVAPIPVVSALNTPKILITEIKLGGGTEHKEFVEIFNDSDESVDVTGWTVEYAKSSFLSTNCDAQSWKGVASPSSQVNTKTLAGLLEPGEFLEVTISMNDAASGSARLISGSTGTFIQYDLVGWGNESPCVGGDDSAPLPANEKSITRIFNPEGHPINTSNNVVDFIIETTPTPRTDTCLETDCYEEPELPVIPPSPLCLVHLSEILANPSGTDAGQEYIELYNPTTTIQTLDGCKLKTGAASIQYLFEDETALNPGEYRIFTAGMLEPAGLQIVNAGGEIWLFDDSEESVVIYPAADDNEAWALVDDEWLATDKPTPNAANQKSATGNQETIEDDETEPCPVGKFRNPETNRCKTIETEDELTACKAGQERNPETNRCRNAAESSLVPCSEGQVRNPETNRCRSVAGASTSLTECQEGYERNPVTNRCRRITGGLASPASLIEANDSNIVTNLNYLVLGLVSALALAYGVYEYRHDFANAYVRAKNRINKARLLK